MKNYICFSIVLLFVGLIAFAFVKYCVWKIIPDTSPSTCAFFADCILYACMAVSALITAIGTIRAGKWKKLPLRNWFSDEYPL